MDGLNLITDYIKNGENNHKRLGLELEHFIINSENESVPFDVLSNLVKEIGLSLCAKLVYIDGYVMGYKLEEYAVSMEPACQLEISISPYDDLKKIRKIYDGFYNIWKLALEKKGYRIITKGLDPRVEKGLIKPSNLKMIPKKRYEYMDKYFLTSGRYGQHMMRASASTQVSLDYNSEEDLKRKLRVLEKLSPFLMLLMDNKSDEKSYLGDESRTHLLRNQVWNDLDSDRCGFLPGSLDPDYSYEEYGRTLMSKPLVVYTENGVTTYAGEKNIIEMGGLKKETVDHLISMFFYNIRIKKYLEVRVCDSVPIEDAIGYAALLKGLMYNEECLSELESLLDSIKSIEDINKVLSEIELHGDEAALFNNYSAGAICEEIVRIAAQGLTKGDSDYVRVFCSKFKQKDKTKFMAGSIFSKEQRAPKWLGACHI